MPRGGHTTWWLPDGFGGRGDTALAVVVALWVPYAALNTAFPGPLPVYLGGLGLAGLAIAAMLWAGCRPAELGLRVHRPSAAGAGWLAALSLFVPLALLVGRGQPWHPLDDLVYAPASALGQELYFRVALLPALAWRGGGGPRRALVVQALLFALWHVRAFRVAAPAPATAALLGTFVAGLVWGWQVRRDGTALYAAVQHTIFLIAQ